MSQTAVVRQLVDLGEPAYALPMALARLSSRQGQPLKQKATIYTCGYQSLHTCYPDGGLEWLRQGSDDAIAMIPHTIGVLHGVHVHRFVNCIPVQSERSRQPRGHLGFHPLNVGLMLGAEENKSWRTLRYVELWILLQSSIMIDDGRDGGDTLHIVTMCRQGKHRSVFWMLVELRILQFCGLDVYYHNTCKWAQQKSGCQTTQSGLCDQCGCIRRDSPHFPDEALTAAIINEFFDTVLLLERLV